MPAAQRTVDLEPYLEPAPDLNLDRPALYELVHTLEPALDRR